MASINSNNFWMYDGSLTTPPCTEGILWNMMQQAVAISPHHLRAMKARYTENDGFANCLAEENHTHCTGGNNRVTMPLKGRKVFFNDSGAIMTGLTALVGLSLASLF